MQAAVLTERMRMAVKVGCVHLDRGEADAVCGDWGALQGHQQLDPSQALGRLASWTEMKVWLLP